VRNATRQPRVMARRRRELEASAAHARVLRGATIVASVALLLVAFIVTGFGRSGAQPSAPSPASVAVAGAGPATATPIGTPDASDPTSARPSPPPTPASSSEATGGTPDATAQAAPATPVPSRSPAPTATPGPTGLPAPSAPPGSAPTTAATFDKRSEIVPMGFPFSKGTTYRYRDNYLEGRSGEPEPYNHWFSRRNGVLRRAHDGVDVYARRGARVLAPLAGTVIDPKTRWKPWRPDRYGTVVVIVSEEPTSVGYTVILSHLDRSVVKVGGRVRRGQYVGTNGTTGNAQGGTPHIHLELRAPFMLRWRELRTWRLVDAFDPYPSLRRADPNRD